MKKVEKCSIGYLDYKKKCQLLKTMAIVAVIAVIIVVGIIIFKNKNNYLTIIAVVGVLPMAKMAVSYFILLPHKSTSVELADLVMKKAGTCKTSFDCVFSTKEKVLGVQAAFVTDSQICLFTAEDISEKSIKSSFEKAVKEFLSKENVNVSLYTDEKQFLKRIEGLAAAFESGEPVQVEKMERITNAMRIMCL